MSRRTASGRARQISLLIPCAVVLCTGLLAGDALRRNHRAAAEIRRGHELLFTVERLHFRLVEAESAQRGFLLTGDAQALRPFEAAGVEIAAALLALEEGLHESPAVAGPVDALRGLATERLRLLQQAIELRRAAGYAGPEVQALATRGSAVMADVHAQIAGIEAERQRELAAWHEIEARQFRGLILVLSFGLLLALAATIGTQRSLTGLIGELERLNHDLEEKNCVLEDQAIELEAQATELHVQARRLHTTSEALETANETLTEKSSRLEEFSRRQEQSNAELMRVNRMLLERTAEAEEANRAKRDFLAVMSHELRTPLNAIAGYAEILQMGLHGPVTDAQMSALDRIRRNQEYLLSLITDVLNFAKEESGRIEVRMADVSVAELIRNVQERIEPQVMANGLRYGYEIPDPAVRVRGDRQRIEQILLNLVGNAIKFTERGGLVRLSCVAEGDRVRLQVTDTGCGIAPGQQRRIFEPFVQAHGEASAHEGGAGLGLAISRQLARQMGGDLTVESVIGTGSSFTLELMRGYRVSDASLFPTEMTIFGSEPPRTGGSLHRPDTRSDAAAAG